MYLTYLGFTRLLHFREVLVAVGFVSVVAGVGIWCRQVWGQRLAALVFILSALQKIYFMSRDGFSVWWMLLSLGLTWAAWSLWWLNFEPESDDADSSTGDVDEEPLLSLVALLPELPYLDSRALAKAASHAWGTEVATEDDDNERSFAVGESPLFMLQHEGRFLLVHHQDRPYVDDPEDAAQHVVDMRVQKAISDHRAWMSVDVLQVGDDVPTISEAYRLIGALLAELIDDSCLAVLCPQQSRVFAYDAGFEEKLRSDDPLSALGEVENPPVIRIADDDPRLVAAVAKARDEWPRFLQAFEQRQADQLFAVKAPIAHEDTTEYIWVNVTAVENDVVYGTLGNDPVDLGNLREGDSVRVPVADLNDWMFTADGSMQGGFSLQVIREAAEEQREQAEQES